MVQLHLALGRAPISILVVTVVAGHREDSSISADVGAYAVDDLVAGEAVAVVAG